MRQKYVKDTSNVCSRRCLIKEKGCKKTYTDEMLYPFGDQILGRFDQPNGYNITLCVECIDKKQHKYTLDDLVFTQLSQNYTIMIDVWKER